jgi:hypothetical protein
VDIAFRACFRPRGLDAYSHKRVKAPVQTQTVVGSDIGPAGVERVLLFAEGSPKLDYNGYGAYEMPAALQQEYYGIPLWGLLAGGAAAYYYYKK